jgi:hypothetical protein
MPSDNTVIIRKSSGANLSDSEGLSSQLEFDSSENSDGGSQNRSSVRKKAMLQSVIEEQTKVIMQRLQTESEQLWSRAQAHRAKYSHLKNSIIDLLRSTISKMWPFATIQSFGSHVSGLSSNSRYGCDMIICPMYLLDNFMYYQHFVPKVLISFLSSDLDLVVCFCDQFTKLPSVTGVIPLLQVSVNR